MNKEESLALFTKGRDAWNAWADKMVTDRKALEAAGTWTAGRTKSKWNDATRDWYASAKADFSEHAFNGNVDFSDFAFPGDATFAVANFPGRALFLRVTFSGDAEFRKASFQGNITFGRATFSGDAVFEKATFLGNTPFDESRFAGLADFRGVSFSSDASFTKTRFSGDAQFIGAGFSGSAGFGRARFSGHTNFKGATFSGEPTFQYATFLGETRFGMVTFSGGAHFTKATFRIYTEFERATFSGDATFDEATFSGYTSFLKAMFSTDARFDRATFLSEVNCQQAVFKGYTEFEGARFEKAVDFRAIKGEGIFSLSGATFLVVPNFVQAHFAEAPRFDDSRIEPRGFSEFTLTGVKETFKGDPNLSARWRALKRLAIQGHDHEREQAFFKGELKSRRWSMDKAWSAVFWFGLLYQWLSDFGRSLIRPLVWWTVSVLGFACLYLGRHLDPTWISISGFGWAKKQLLAFVGTDPPPLACVAGPGDPWLAALGLSLRKGLLFFGLDSTDKLNQIYSCLYGILAGPNTSLGPGRLPIGFIPVIPDSTAFFGLVQLLFSAVLIFLFLLAIRNHFRIK